jgi:surface antigen
MIMHIRHLRTSASLILAVSVAAIPLYGCESIERETGLSKETQTGAAGGAAFGGIIAALAGANPAWIAASILLGGVTGGVIGNALGKEDAQKHADNNLHSLDTLGAGQSSTWEDSKTGNSGGTTVTAVNSRQDGTICKSYTETVKTSAKTVTQQATACKAPGGGWKVQGA